MSRPGWLQPILDWATLLAVAALLVTAIYFGISDIQATWGR